MTQQTRNDIYTKIFTFMIEQNINLHPTPIKAICDNLGIELIPLSKITDATGLSADAVFSIWGNEDGAVQVYRSPNSYKYKISYNNFVPLGRMRFTIMEELSHILLGHTKNPAFNIFNQAYDETVYSQYDKEARIAAGLLLCSPKFYYPNRASLSPTKIAQACAISEKCATVRCCVYDRFEDEIVYHPLYHGIPAPYFILSAAG